MQELERRMIQRYTTYSNIITSETYSYKHIHITHKAIIWLALSFPSKQRPNNLPTATTLLRIFGVDKLHVHKLRNLYRRRKTPLYTTFV
jgi:hypothetical protein